MNVTKVYAKTETEVLMSHGFEPRHFSACVIADGGRNHGKGIVINKCGHQHLTRTEAEGCLVSIVPTPHAIGLTDGNIVVLVPEGSRW